MPELDPQETPGDANLGVYQKKPSIVARLGRHLRGRYHWAILAGFLFALPGAVIGFIQTVPNYRSNAMLRITPLTLKILYAQNDIVPSIFESFVDVQCNIMKSRPMVESVIRSPEWLEARGNSVPIEPEVFLRNLEITHPIRSEIISVSYTDASPQAARDGVRMILQAYLKVHGDRSGNQRMVATEERAATLSKKLIDLRQSMADIANEHGTDDLKHLHQTKVLELNKIESMVKDTEINLILTEAALGKGDTFKNMPAAEIASSDELLRRLLDEKGKYESELGHLRNFAGEKHPDVVALKKRLREMDQKVETRCEEFRNFRRTSFVNNMGALEGVPTPAAVDSLRQRHSKLQDLYQKALDRSLEIGRKSLVIANLQEEFRITKERLSESQNKLDQLRVDSSVVGQINIINEGDLPQAPVKDRRRMMAMGGGAAGFFIGFGLVTALALVDRRLRVVGDLSASGFDLPLLGALPAPGASNFTDEAARGIRQITTALQLDPDLQDARVIALAPARGKARCEDVAAGVAVALARSKKTTLLIDFDFVHTALTQRSQLEPWRAGGVGLAQVLAGTPLKNACAATDVENLSLLPCNLDLRTLSLSASEIVGVLKQAAELFDRVIVAVGSLADHLENSLVTMEAESVLLCVDPATTDANIEAAVRGIVSANASLGGVIYTPVASDNQGSWLGTFADAAR